jgi:hypothetical protein
MSKRLCRSSSAPLILAATLVARDRHGPAAEAANRAPVRTLGTCASAAQVACTGNTRAGSWWKTVERLDGRGVCKDRLEPAHLLVAATSPACNSNTPAAMPPIPSRPVSGDDDVPRRQDGVGLGRRFDEVQRDAQDHLDVGRRALAGDLLSNRSVVLQERFIGSTSWATIRTLTPSSTIDGRYSYTWSPTVTADWRAVFLKPSGEGLLGSTSGIIRVTVDGCLGSGCPVMPVAG